MHPTRLTGFRFIYGGFAAVLPLFTMVTLFATTTNGDVITRYHSEWQTAGRNSEALLGVVLVWVLVALLLVAVFRTREGAVLPGSIAVLALIGIVMLATKVGTSSPKPPFTDAGAAELLGAIWLAAVSIAHCVVHLVATRSRPDTGQQERGWSAARDARGR